jgi:DNA-binding IclR family transcriptional regulator
MPLFPPSDGWIADQEANALDEPAEFQPARNNVLIKMTTLERPIYRAVEMFELEGERPTIGKVARYLGIPFSTAQKRINALIDKGLLSRNKSRILKIVL